MPEDELREKAAAAVSADDPTRQQFALSESCKRALDGFSHQLRTPLTTIGGLAETLLIREGLDTSTQRQFLEKIHDQVTRARTVLEELRVLTKLDREANITDMEVLDLLIPVAEAMQGLVQSAELKGLEVVISTPTEPVYVLGDGSALRLLTANLIENAIRYSHYGGSLKLSVAGDGDKARLTVEDKGVGIAAEEQELVFDVFFRGQQGRQMARQGTGLGLALVKQIAAIHGGEVKLVSTLDEGTVITVAIPLADAQAG